MNAKDLHGMAVVSLGEANKLGAVDDVWFDAHWRTVLGFGLQHDAHHAPEGILRSSVTAIGHDVLTVAHADALIDIAQHPLFQTAVSLRQLVGTHVVSEQGDVLGTIDDVELDATGQTVQAYLLSMSLLERLGQQQHKIAVDRVIQVGVGNLMTVSQSSAT